MKRDLPVYFLSIMLILPAVLPAQSNTTITNAIIHSAVLNEDRQISIYIPRSAAIKKPGITYPVIFLFDAESLFAAFTGSVSFMNYSSTLPQMPECYVVGIYNTNRGRDMPVPQEFQQGNGADNFYKFLSTELLPYINTHYQTSGLNVLAGHSQGGLFVTYAGLQAGKLFRFILALDAPVTVNATLQKTLEQQMYADTTLRYFSAETLYGWDKTFPANSAGIAFAKAAITGETHETMPYKGIYEGLKFLFKEHVPPQKDLALPALQLYYNTLAGKYHCTYNIPAAIILNSAKEKIGASKKLEALALLHYYEETYTPGTRSTELLQKANAITKGPDLRVDNYLNHATPTDDAIKPYLGTWEGTVTVPGGDNTHIKWQIKNLNGKYVMHARVMDAFNSVSDFLFISNNNELVWGRKHDGGGVYVSVGKLSADGFTLTGTEDLIGFDFPKDFPPFKLNTFEFKKLTDAN